MMKKRSFLVPFATLATAVATEQASAMVSHQPADQSTDTPHSLQFAKQSENLSVRSGDDIFAFVLKRGEQGEFMAYHSSHSSHASHSSHRSHVSGS